MSEKQPHIQLDDGFDVKKAIIVGDPARVDKIGSFLKDSRTITFNREFKSLIGTYQNIKILVISTGIGAPSTAIAVEELYNIGITDIIRVGSCGGMQSFISLGELVIPVATVRDEGLTKKYVDNDYPAIPAPDFMLLAKSISPTSHFGITRSHDGFYMDDNDKTEKYWSEKGIIGADMETSTLFVLGTLRGIRTLSILNNVVLYEGDLKAGVNDLVEAETIVKEGEQESIKLALNILTIGGK